MKFISRFYILLCWTYLILVLLTMPMKTYEIKTVTYYDKVVHAILFGVFVYFLNRVLLICPKLKSSTIIAIGFLLGVAYSGLGEYMQLYIPSRTVSEYDFLAGVTGVFIASIISYEILHRQRK